jgi:hypothetical protein
VRSRNLEWWLRVVSVPYRPGTLAYRIQVKTKSMTCYHVSSTSGPRLPVEEGSGAATCPISLSLAFLPRRTLVIPCVPRLWTLSPC